MLPEPKFGENICFNLLHYHVSKMDRVADNNGMSQAAWDEVLKHHVEDPRLAKKVAKNIVIGILASEEMVRDAKIGKIKLPERG